jgi:hypothetical protein
MKKPMLLYLLCFAALAHAQTDCPWNATSCHVEYTDNGTTTSFHVEHKPNTAAVVGSEVGTAAALTYFFEIRPELQRIHNEKINLIEGEFQDEYRELEALVAVATPNVQGVPSDPAVHGYRLGESWVDFVAASPRLKANIVACASRPIPKQTKKHRVYDPCADVRYMGQSGAGAITMSCRDSDKAKDMMCRDFNGEVTFIDSKLAALKIILPGVSLEGAELKFGPPSGIDNDKSSEVWHSTLYSVAADRLNNGIALLWENPVQYAKTVKARQQIAVSITTEKKPVVSSHGGDF